ncbi:MAG: hypothetical protein AVDCRST_MAG31-1685 [uncultured Sphingomonas sp.]|uniref:Xanthan biosynthesis exopolysaccharide polymerase GumE n=1 Tax=uncultured Sphingomonas sp. TaxID=158754 RepID=A0A6J4TH90_9SPHN|nr:hypothetical protein [uncultured Sphingomonas sp.]CAA9521997.1 MAG: hypothetical protein AVDCRST_MAG31-1685 [uncultured Sphingomonas sp.]
MLTRSRPVARGAAMPASRLAIAAAEPVGATSTLPEKLIWASVLFNLLLCFIDSNLVTLSPFPVMAVEAAILGAALLVPLALHSRSPGRMDFLLILLLASWLLLSILRQSVDPKLFRDIAIMPIFVLLGLASRGVTLHRRLFWLHMTVFVFALWEAISVQSFVSVLSIGDYFEHTRRFSNDDWWVDSGLYLSAVRPESRFLFPGLPLHRLSSVFLEPVSLGNYVMIATIWLAGFWRRIPSGMRVVAVLANLFLLVGSDSRMASLTCLVLVLAIPLGRLLPSYIAVLTAPIVIGLMFLADVGLGLQAGTDDFGGRIAHSVDVFRAMEVQHYAGLAVDLLRPAEDAGFAYVIMSQSLLVALIVWGSLLLRRLVTPEGRYVHLAVAIYVSMNLTVSWSLFSIKTAALLWFLLGRAIREDREATVDAAADLPRSGTGVELSGGRLAGSIKRVAQ